MKTYQVIISDTAEADLVAIYDYIADRAGREIALRFVTRIETYCRRFETVPHRGMSRSDLRPRLRTIGFRRRATILFEVDDEKLRVVVHGIYYAGRDIGTFEQGDDDAAT